MPGNLASLLAHYPPNHARPDAAFVNSALKRARLSNTIAPPLLIKISADLSCALTLLGENYMAKEPSEEMLFQPKVAFRKNAQEQAQTAWAPHPKFKGVALQNILTSAETKGRLSVHLVRVEPGCALAEHQHEEQWELHEVLQGAGECWLEEQLASYMPGTLAVIPLGQKHQVKAGAQGLLIKAVFVPALV
jgi:quercetin dioxygenase-like cupin family protein